MKSCQRDRANCEKNNAIFEDRLFASKTHRAVANRSKNCTFSVKTKVAVNLSESATLFAWILRFKKKGENLNGAKR